jgi:radical SAM superfamily enzyme YgiQ (UPF0313 family)
MLPKAWKRRLVDMKVRPLTTADLKAEGKTVVVGGPYASMGLNDAIEADHVFAGEVETTFPEFFHDFEHGEAKAVYQAAERPPLSLTPIPDFGLAELSQYSNMSVQYSRLDRRISSTTMSAVRRGSKQNE